MSTSGLRRWISALSDFVFPRACLHCLDPVGSGFLCFHCSQVIELMDLSTIKGEDLTCKIKQKIPVHRIFTSQSIGPAVDLANYSAEPSIAKNIAALMVVQLCKFSNELPSFLAPAIEDGLGSIKVAEFISQLLEIPSLSPLSTEKLSLQSLLLSNKYKKIPKKNRILIVSVKPLNDNALNLIIRKLQSLEPSEITFFSFLS